ncbi:MAG: hypothetical protein PF542_01605 [Nanoarchaeota archaeon]|jgi:hypothetical protein|nr:hypothetical protein [Nanoarchaeota archaeon]
MNFSEDWIRAARILDDCVNHPSTNKDRYKFCNYSFVSKEDEIEATKKYQ